MIFLDQWLCSDAHARAEISAERLAYFVKDDCGALCRGDGMHVIFRSVFLDGRDVEQIDVVTAVVIVQTLYAHRGGLALLLLVLSLPQIALSDRNDTPKPWRRCSNMLHSAAGGTLLAPN